MKRVLLGDFSALQRLGFEDILRREDIELVRVSGGQIVERLVDTLPDVVVLDADAGDSPQIVGHIVHEFPAVTVIACSSESPTMRVFLPLHYGESYVSALDPALLTTVIQS